MEFFTYRKHQGFKCLWYGTSKAFKGLLLIPVVNAMLDRQLSRQYWWKKV
jgi:hypothetical protein